MPLFRKGSTKGTDYKARLEHKLYLARENPDPVFDLSECDLKAVPSGVYSLCRVFRKESLLLQKNNLTSLSGGGSFEDLSLLQTIDLSSNSLTNLPEDIKHLRNLQELFLSNNLLKTLPESIGELGGLKILNCSFNKLKRLPDGIGNLQELKELHLQGNPALCVLPNKLSQAKCLTQLVLDIGRYTHPPNELVVQGTIPVLRFLAFQLGEEFSGKSSNGDNVLHQIPQVSQFQTKEKEIQATLKMLEKKKEEKMQERLAVEKGISEQKEQEFKIHNVMKIGKDKLMEDLIKQQSKIAEEVVRFQNRKEAERTKLIEEIHKVEESADQVINQMLVLNNTLREPTRVMEQEELDRKAQEKLFTKHSEQLRRIEVISAMESLLTEERLQRDRLREYEEIKAQVVKNTLHRDVEWDEEINRLLCDRNAKQSAVVAAVAADESYQVAAVAALLERSDTESCRLRAQLHLVERQLAALTALELHRNNHNLIQLQCDLSEKRTALSHLLVEILNQQKTRKKHLLQTLRKMERHRLEELEKGDDYWLVQYQRLLDSRPQGLLYQGLDTRLVHHMVSYGVVHCLPFLESCNLEALSHESLQQIGVTNEEDRGGILKAVSAYLSESAVPSSPSAPFEEIPCAPPTSECIVCMNAECEVVFVPCGHLCCCCQCSNKLGDCPLCRSHLDHIIRIIQV